MVFVESRNLIKIRVEGRGRNMMLVTKRLDFLTYKQMRLNTPYSPPRIAPKTMKLLTTLIGSNNFYKITYFTCSLFILNI